MKLDIVQRAVASALILLLASCAGWAQEKSEEAPAKRKGTIKGKVVSEDGQPVEGANVNLNALTLSGPGGWRQVQTDGEGNFVADGLPPALYGVHAGSTAYVLPEMPLEQKYYRLGDVVNFTLVKGGVITGRVTNAQGEPVIAVPIIVERIADLESRKISGNWWYGLRKTDDRGVYRVYGLPAGKYLVSVGGKAPYRSGPPSPYESDTPTYYPSSTRDGASEVTVNLGDEVRGIDIRYRAEKGHSVSGRVTGAPPDSSVMTGGIQVALHHFPSRRTAMWHFIQATDVGKTFEFFSLPDGEYELVAYASGSGQDDTKDPYQSPRKRITVKGGNVSGIELRLLPLASVQGKIEWEVTPEKERKAECKGARPPFPEETAIRLAKDDPTSFNEFGTDVWPPTAVPNEKNEIKFRGLEAGRYRFDSNWLDEAWYVKSITAKGQSVSVKAPSADAKPTAPATVDIGKQGLQLKPGEKRTDVVLTITNGAASIRGQVTAEKNQTLPSRLRVYLVPAEKEAAEDLLRYGEQKTKDGTFTFTNLAPGKYWVLARRVPENESDTKRVHPAAWDSTTRKALRAEAEAKNNLLELKTCQRVNDYALKFAP